MLFMVWLFGIYIGLLTHHHKNLFGKSLVFEKSGPKNHPAKETNMVLVLAKCSWNILVLTDLLYLGEGVSI